MSWSTLQRRKRSQQRSWQARLTLVVLLLACALASSLLVALGQTEYLVYLPTIASGVDPTQQSEGNEAEAEEDQLEDLGLPIYDAQALLDLSATSATTLNIPIAAKSDDAEESAAGVVTDYSRDLEMVFADSNQTVGLRFVNLALPKGITITNAYLQFVADEVTTVATTLTLRSQATDSTLPFTNTQFNLSSRPRSSARVTWSPAPWTQAGQAGAAQRTPNLAPLLQEVVNRPGWSNGNSLAILVTGTGKRNARSFNVNPLYAPILHVEFVSPPRPVVVRVPQDQPTIQAGIDAARSGDLVLVAPGVYHEQLILANKAITLASTFYSTSNPSLIDQTILDGDLRTVIKVEPSATGSAIVGFTIQNGEDGIRATTYLSILNNHFINLKDALDYEGGSGVCRNNVFDNNRDDAIDLDGASAVLIENNLIRGSSDDGIEVRLEPYTGVTLTITIRNNEIISSNSDGIQLIGYPDLSHRHFRIERNLIRASKKVGLGMMDNAETVEDFRAASLLEPVHVFNNTFVGGQYAVSGGDNLVALNNLFVGASKGAIKGVDGNSIAAYNLFWNNAVNSITSTVHVTSSRFVDPLLTADYRLQNGSPAVDGGTAQYVWRGQMVLNMANSEFTGSTPDLGKFEK